jgi:hypothetical protein
MNSSQLRPLREDDADAVVAPFRESFGDSWAIRQSDNWELQL